MSDPSWLNNSDSWPEQIVAKPSDVSESESRTIKTVMKAAVQRKFHVFDDLLAKIPYGKLCGFWHGSRDLLSIVEEVKESADH